MNTTTPLLVDGAIWLSCLMGEPTILPQRRTLIEEAAATNQLFISASCLQHIAFGITSGTIAVTMPCHQWVTMALERSHTRIAPITQEIIIESAQLPTAPGQPLTLSREAALQVATARILGALFLTDNESIINYANHKFLRIAS